MSVVTEAAMQQVKEPHARLPRDEERDAIVRVGRGQRTKATRHPDLNQGCLGPQSRSSLGGSTVWIL